MITADHGPAVSGAHNTIVCARAGKDLVSSLVSGLLTIVRALHKIRTAFNRIVPQLACDRYCTMPLDDNFYSYKIGRHKTIPVELSL
jgi:hypothetical protein